ncbi:MAG: hypothetical protein JWM33_1749, partial [Caulobacteraceae bacterium]|nr:hypothetical protein [Caulobacteraceae bacterium]
MRARRMRTEPTVAERMLWKELRSLDLHIRRQVPIGRYIADFAHHESKLLIEVDGYHHSTPEGREKDAIRTAWLSGEGYRVLSFDEKVVRNDLPDVVARIAAEIQQSPPSPTLPPSRGKGE